jgi:hypothetical protein
MMTPADKSKSITKLRDVYFPAEFPLENDDIAIAKITTERIGG